ncbi:MAG TPA: FtsX-like permease family protein [Actinomycetota bacterium]|nr:FtsX-like permease family protein [Actinomycetota bacterium]
MLKATIKALLAHKLRLALTALAVVLGVAFMAGTLVLTGSIKKSLTSIFSQSQAGKAVIVRGISSFGNQNNQGQGFGGNTRPLVPESLLTLVQSVPGVEVADGAVQGTVTVVGKDGKSVAGHFPTLGFAWEPDHVLSLLSLRTGRPPQRAGEVVIDQKTATAKHLTRGSRVTVTGNLGPQSYTVVGVMGFGTQDTVAGATIVAFDTATAQRIIGQPGFFTEIDVASTPGNTVEQLVSAIGRKLPPHFEAVSAAAVAKQNADAVNSFVSIFNDFLLAFAFISLFVGAFLIFNTFTILVGQRTRELALLRAVGAGRGQVVASVLGEAILTGLFGSAVGLGVGIVLAYVFYHLVKSFLSLSATSLQITPWIVVLSLVVGTVITSVSALIPALRAARVPPVAAMRDDVTVVEAPLRRRATIGGVVLAVGLGLLAAGLFGTKTIQVAGAGAAVTFIGVAMLVPLFAGPLARFLGLPLPLLQGVKGRIGKENAARNPRRTAATASALMIGVAVVTAIATLVTSAVASFTGIFDKSFQASYVISSTNEDFADLPVQVALHQLPGIAAASGFQSLEFHLKGADEAVGGLDAVQGPKVFNVQMVSGSVKALAEGKLLVDQTTATNDHVHLGDTLVMTFATTGAKSAIVGGIYRDNFLLGHYVLESSLLAANTNTLRDVVLLVKASSPSPAFQSRIKKALAGFPNLKIQTGAEFNADQEKQVKGSLNFVYALLFLSIIIALFGILNTLALSVFERTREIGLMRAVGMFRPQVRGMIRGEAVIITLIGAVLGIVVGVGIGVAIVETVAGQSGSPITQVAFPISTLITVIIGAILGGILAAILPAIRASRLDVLRAITTV